MENYKLCSSPTPNCSCIHPFNKYLNTYYMPGTVLGIWLYSKKQTNKYSFGTQILVKGDIYMTNNNTDE